LCPREIQCMKEEELMSKKTSEQSHADFSMTSDEYQGLWDADLAGGYPANHFAFRQVISALREEPRGDDSSTPRMLEVGIGHGNAVSIFSSAGYEFWGLDNDPTMVRKSQGKMEELGFPEDRVKWGDIEDSLSLSKFDSGTGFDSVLAMGVLPHVTHERVALENMRQLTRPGGTVFVECRNKLFSLVTFNRFTYEFIMDDLLGDVEGPVRDAADEFLKNSRRHRCPGKSPVGGTNRSITTPSRLTRSFLDAGFTNIQIRPFHYHAAMPRFEKNIGRKHFARSQLLWRMNRRAGVDSSYVLHLSCKRTAR